MKRIIMTIVFCLCSLISACSPKEETVCARSMFSENMMSLPVKAVYNRDNYMHYGGALFNWNENIDQLMERCSESIREQNAEFARYDYPAKTCYSIFVPQENGTKEYFYLGNSGTYRFVFCGMKTRLKSSDLGENILVPWHLISDDRVGMFSSCKLMVGTKYECLAPTGAADKDLQDLVQDFVDFYESTGEYEVSSIDSGMIITRDEVSVSIVFEDGSDKDYVYFQFV